MAQYIITGIFAVLVALIEWRAQKDTKSRKASEAKAETRAQTRAEESRLSMQLADANCQLATVTAKAVLHQHTNGDVEAAMTAAEAARAAYTKFIREQAAAATAKI